MPTPREARPRVMNPLWIISLFLGISELTVGVAATQSSGWVQSVFTVFAVTFPTCVAGVFFAIVWTRPFVLYAPADFPRHTPVSAFVEAMKSSSSMNTRMLESMVKSAVEAAAPAIQPKEAIDQGRLSSAVEGAVVAARREFEQNAVYVSMSGISDRLGGVAVPIHDDSTVSDLLNEVWFHLADYVPPYTYGQTWEVVKADATGTPLIVSSPSARTPDERLLKEIGVTTSDRLVARLLGPRVK